MNASAANQMVTAGWGVVGLYAAVILFFVVRGARQNQSLADYALGNLAFSPVAVGLALAASMTSAATFIINPGFIALYGLSGVLSYGVVLPLAAVVSLIVLTKGFRRHGIQVKALSLAQWMGTRYQSKGFALFYAVLSLLLITFIVLIVVGLTKVLSKTLAVSEMGALLGLVVFVFGYMMFGGANSMVYTNTVQAVLMLIVAGVLLGSGYENFSDGVHGFLDRLRQVDPALVGATNPDSFLFRGYFEIIVAQIVVGVAIVCQPHIITKSLLLKTDRDVTKYLATGVIAELIFFAVVFVGLYARVEFPDLTAGGVALKMDGIIPTYVIHEFPVWLGLVVVMGLISAGLSTLEGLVQALATTLTGDLVAPLAGAVLPVEGSPERERILLLISRVVILLLAVAAVFLSWEQLQHPKLSVAIFAQNGVYAYFSAAFVPIIFGMFIPRTAKVVAVSAAVTAVVVHFTMYYGKIAVPGSSATGENPGVAAAVAILVSVLVGTVMLQVTRGGKHEVS
ncbi:MAG: sodium:solute symporter [Candidatus Krumholzibacteria bacterium]|nr:sodium:solute symporter [Candidatus Krumholzibacteria bacterium]